MVEKLDLFLGYCCTKIIFGSATRPRRGSRLTLRFVDLFQVVDHDVYQVFKIVVMLPSPVLSGLRVIKYLRPFVSYKYNSFLCVSNPKYILVIPIFWRSSTLYSICNSGTCFRISLRIISGVKLMAATL